MKHLLNNLSNEEKNRIREQYEGGMSVDNSRFKKLMESKLGNVKPLIMEQTSVYNHIPNMYNANINKVPEWINQGVPVNDTSKKVPVNDASKHICSTDKTNSKIHIGKSFNYCKNGENYYFIGTLGDFKTKYPNWTKAEGKGLESIKTKIFYK